MPRSEATTLALPVTIAIPEPCQCFLVWGQGPEQAPVCRLGCCYCVLPYVNPTSQGLSLVLYPQDSNPFLTKEPAHTGEHTQAFTAPFVWPSSSSLSSSQLEQNRNQELGCWQCGSVDTLPRHLAHMLWICPCPSWPALEAGTLCRLTLESAGL